MNNEDIILRGIDEIPMFTFNTKTKEFSVLGHKFEGVNSIEDFINYIYNLGTENQQLKENVNKLETNIDEVIKVLKDAGCYDEETKTFCDDVWDELPYILETLERGKE